MNRQHSSHRPALILAWVSAAVVVGSMIFASGARQGWIGLLGYAGLACSFPLAGLRESSRSASVAGAVMLLTFGADFGLPRVWSERPAWIDGACNAAVLLSCLVFARLAWPRRAVPATES